MVLALSSGVIGSLLKEMDGGMLGGTTQGRKTDDCLICRFF